MSADEQREALTRIDEHCCASVYIEEGRQLVIPHEAISREELERRWLEQILSGIP